jgi:hypothetical protein
MPGAEGFAMDRYISDENARLHPPIGARDPNSREPKQRQVEQLGKHVVAVSTGELSLLQAHKPLCWPPPVHSWSAMRPAKEIDTDQIIHLTSHDAKQWNSRARIAVVGIGLQFVRSITQSAIWARGACCHAYQSAARIPAIHWYLPTVATARPSCAPVSLLCGPTARNPHPSSVPAGQRHCDPRRVRHHRRRHATV